MQNNSIMKKLLVLLFSILISFNTYGEWVKVSTTIDGTEYYVEIDTIKEHNGYVYSWRLFSCFYEYVCSLDVWIRDGVNLG